MANLTIGRYQIEQELGRGGMAVVYLAQDPAIKRRVAIKVLPRQFTFDPQFRERFQREAEIIAALEHPFIVPIYDFGQHDDQPFLVMRLMPGGSLVNRLKTGPLPLPETAAILERVGAALDRAHIQGIIHRDLKPGNILFDQYGEAFLADFGIARLSESHHTLTGTAGVVGTPAYMSPEQASGETGLDGRSDGYALGVIAFQMLTGQTPYQADTPLKLMFKHVTEPVPDILTVQPDLPAACAEVMARALAKKPADRFATAGQLTAALAAITRHTTELPILVANPLPPPNPAAGHPPVDPTVESPTPAKTAPPPANTTPTVATPVAPVSPPVRRNRAWGGIAGLLAVGVIALLGAIFWAVNGSRQPAPGATPASQMSAAPATALPTATKTSTTRPPAPAVISDTLAMTPRPTEPPPPTPTALPTGTSTGTPTPEAATLAFTQTLNVRAGPGTAYPVIGQAQAQATAVIIGRTAAGDWLQIDYPTAANPTGWVLAKLARLSGNPAVVAVVTVIPPPTPTPAATATATTAPPSAGASAGRIAFVSYRDGYNNIYVMNPDGSGVTRLTNYEWGDYAPAWSPDGTRIAFVRTGKNYNSSEIYIMNADGSGQVNLTNSPGYDGNPAWSPDGRRIAFIQATQNTNGDSFVDSGDAADVYVINADGSGQANLTHNLAKNYGPIWSPDGTQIAFHSNQSHSYWVINADGSNAVEIEEQQYWLWQTRSPDGKYFLYIMGGEISRFNADGTGRTYLVSNLSHAYGLGWSPDGSRIIFTSNHEGNYEIYTANADGSGKINLTNNPAFDGNPVWSLR